MASLACVKDLVSEDFLLVEGNQILETRGFEKLLNSPKANGALLAPPSGSGDEAYVELDQEGCNSAHFQGYPADEPGRRRASRGESYFSGTV